MIDWIDNRRAATLAALLSVALGPLASAGPPKHLRVIWRESPQTKAIVSWSTDDGGSVHQLRWRAAGQGDWRTTPTDRDGEHSGGGMFFHHVRLTGLEPATRYQLIAESDGDASSEHWFRTAPEEDVPVQLINGGDSRSGREHRRLVNKLIKRVFTEAERAGRPPVIAFAHSGDFIVQGNNLDQWRGWLDDHELAGGDDGRLLPLIPTRGNHDYGPIFNQLFDFPERDRNYYQTVLTPSVRLVTLNTETATGGDQRAWLAERLAAVGPETRWLMCQYHKPAYPAVKLPSGALANWSPLFDEFGVDLALEGDGHCIKRTPPIKGGKLDPTGTVYVGEGGLGVNQRTPKPERWYLRPPGVTGRGHHVHLLEIDGDQLTGRAILINGSVFDEFTLTARRRTGGAPASE